MCDSDEEFEEKHIKLVVVGDGSAGKSSIVNRFVNSFFNKDYRQTIGIDFFSHVINLPGISAKVNLWDIGGQTLGGPLLNGYIHSADGILFVYDITNNNSFENIVDWLETAKKIYETESKKMPYMALVGNKVDLEHSRAVRMDKHEKFAHDSGMSSHFVSARTGDSVSLCLYSITAEICGVRLTQAELNRQKTVVKAGIQSVATNRPSGLRGPQNQSVLPKFSNNTGEEETNNSNSRSDQSNSQTCTVL